MKIGAENIRHIITADIAWNYKIIPHSLENNILTLLVDEVQSAKTTINELELVTGYDVKIISEKSDVILQHLTRNYRKNSDTRQIRTLTAQENIDDFLTKIITEAKELKSSDIHIEAFSDSGRIRLRIDGKLIQRYHISKEQYPFFINKIKIKAGLDIAEKRLPQDGRIAISSIGEKIELRVSVMPALYGEKVVLRLLASNSSHVSLDQLGFNVKQLTDYTRTLKKTYGIILISGPTGSGKTTTLYATLKSLNNEYNNILTIEDPIEYTLDGITQVQLKENIGLTFSSALRSFLRQDPDIIMLGEIRDPETAQMAIRAALTGHLVLSTIHTNSAWGIVSRLVDMGIPSFLLANTLNMTVAQRLVRKLCVHCKCEIDLNPNDYPEIDFNEFKITNHAIAAGCSKCFYTGYLGRQAVYEVISLDNELSMLIRESASNIKDKLIEKKISSLHENAMQLVYNKITSIEEIFPILLNH